MDLLDRLYQRLMDAVARETADPATASFTIAEMYQQLVPYRAVRGELQLLELAQYEHALLRLLAGERGYLQVESPQVQTELRRELASVNPILGIYRDYAQVRVRLDPDVPEVDSSPSLDAASTVEDSPAAGPPPSREPAAPPPLPVPPVPSVCHQCEKPLPALPDVRFCPRCGANQMEVPCAECGQLLQSDWSFCIRCGTRRQGR